MQRKDSMTTPNSNKMTFPEKLHHLRTTKNLTQEQLAEKLFVSRTAISKWESGRGYPSIDSLRMIAKFFDVTVDELISSESVLTIAEENGKCERRRLGCAVAGLLDICTLLLLFLPLFAQRVGDGASSVSLSALGCALYIKILYVSLTLAIAVCGALTLAFSHMQSESRMKICVAASLAFGAVGLILFILGRHPYAAVLLFVLLSVKVLIHAKQR